MNFFKNKKNIIGIILVVLITIIGIFALVPINKNYQDNNWLNEVNDDLLITELSIPGTHDSGAMHSFLDVAGKCQDLTIRKQLAIGVRFWI